MTVSQPGMCLAKSHAHLGAQNPNLWSVKWLPILDQIGFVDILEFCWVFCHGSEYSAHPVVIKGA